MTASVLSQTYKVQKTEGNFNNLIGVPITLLNLREDTELAVIELGANGFGEIARAAELVLPKLGLITNIAASHLEGFCDLEGIYNAKKELVDSLPIDGAAFLNGDDENLDRMIGEVHCPVTTFGLEEKNDVFPRRLKFKEDSSFSFKIGKHTVEPPAIGKGNLYNCLAATAVGQHYDVPDRDIKRGLESTELAGMRMQRERLQDLQLIIDCYNANPASMQLALETLGGQRSKGKKIAVLGDMLELGPGSPEIHYELGRYCSDIDLDVLITVGNEASEIARGCDDELAGSSVSIDVVSTHDLEQSWEELSKRITGSELILFKASRGVGLETVVERLRKSLPAVRKDHKC